uniref:C-type lectin domain-containing protein n=1 Tax=Sinocyclocheilus grahami TaxID=75366 RepID=A0A672QAC6_SINGR
YLSSSGSDSVKIRSSGAALVCLVLMCVLLLTAVIVLYGWTYYKFSLYFISSEWKSWTESRRYCTERGADLIIINNREEQEFINKISGGAGVWIGLTDSDVEGRWKWVDGTNMTSGLKNCAVSYSSGWYDYQCNNGPYKWICEKSFVKYHIP